MKLILVLGTNLWLLTASLQAQIRCTASVEQAVVEQGASITLNVEVSGPDLNITEPPQLPAMKGIEPQYRQAGESTSISIINGRKSVTKSYQFLLRAKEVGRWQIPPIVVHNDGNAISTQTVTIEVVPAGSMSGTQRQQQSNDAFLAVTLSKKEAFVGEQITAETKIYTRVSISQYSPSKLPNLTGFWSEEFPIQQPISASREQVGGVMYQVYTIKRTALFPTHAGDLTVEPSEVECELRIPRKNRGGVMDDFFSPFADPFGQTVNAKLSSQALNIHVNPLPENDRPDNFFGLVGNFDIKTSVDKTTLKTGEAIVYSVDISGNGNLFSVETPLSPFSDDFEKYDPKVTDQIVKTGGLLGGKKTIDYVAIPRVARSLEIPEFKLSYFDPRQKKYITKSSPAINVSIRQGTGTFANSAGLSKEEVTLLSKDIRFIKTGIPDWNSDTSPLYQRWWFFLIGAFPFISVFVFSGYLRFKKEALKDPLLYRYQQASPLAKKRLKNAEALLKQNQVDIFYTEMAKLLSGFITDKLGLRGSEMLRDKIAEKLRERHIDELLIKRFLDCLHVCDEARFSPDRSDLAHIRDVYDQIREAILSLDKAL